MICEITLPGFFSAPEDEQVIIFVHPKRFSGFNLFMSYNVKRGENEK